jgi:hypothetical protein
MATRKHDRIPYRSLRASRGPRREFKITLGLRAGYGPAGRIYDLEEAVRAAHEWMIRRARRRQFFLTGMFTRGEVLYARAPLLTEREPVAIFSGEALPLVARQHDDATIEALLDELATEMARTLEQEEVHIAYRDRTWTLRRARTASPRKRSRRAQR